MRLVGRQLAQPKLVQRRLPRRDAVLCIKSKKIVRKFIELFGQRGLIAGRAQHPPVTLEAVGDIGKAVDKVVPKAVICKKFRYPNAFKRRITGSFEDASDVRSAFPRGDPISGRGSSRLRFEEFVGPLRYAKSGQGLLAFFNQASVKLDKRRTRLKVDHGI